MITEQQHADAARKWQKFFDDHLRDIGGSAPPYIPGQTTGDYLRETCRAMKRSYLPPIHPLYKVQWRDREGLRGDALQVLVPQLMEACKAEAENPNTVAPGQFREVAKRNPYGQVMETRFIGPECFVRAMGRPGRRVKSFSRPFETIKEYSSKTGWAA